MEAIYSYLYSPTDWESLADSLADFASAKKDGNTTRPQLTQIPGPHFPVKTIASLPGNKMFTPPNKRSSPTIQSRRLLKRQDEELGPLEPLSHGADMQDQYETMIIFCGDSADTLPEVTTADVFEELVRVSQTVSPKFGGIISSRAYCHRWTSRAVERYTGPWNNAPKNVVLVIGNEADPITPYRSAKLVASDEYLGSHARLILQQNFGHTSGAMASRCTLQAVRNYLSGTLPDDGGDNSEDLYCSTASSLFGLPADTDYDPQTSENGDELTSGPSDPGLRNLGDGSGNPVEDPNNPSSSDSPDNNGNDGNSSSIARSPSSLIPILLALCTCIWTLSS